VRPNGPVRRSYSAVLFAVECGQHGAAERARLRAGAEKPKPQRRTWTVSQLTDRLQGVLETEFFDVWVEGEVSNVTMPASGHWYFSLKDSNAQVRAVVWKTAARLIKFKPRDGMKVLVRGAVRVYPPKGEYQIAVEVIEPWARDRCSRPSRS
jgi:hypothetical protein